MTDAPADRTPLLSPWRMVVALGLVSLAADMVADGGKSIIGPFLGSLGASALVVALVMGAAEAVSLVLRLVVGPLADRSGNHWSWTIAGYALTAACIPLLALAPLLGGAGMAVAIVLVLTERAGKAVRSPSKTALLAHAAGAVGRGRGFGVHKTLDLVGATAGPIVVAGVVAADGRTGVAFAVLIVPGLATMALLAWLRRRVPDPSVYDEPHAPGAPAGAEVDAARAVGPTSRAWWAQAVGSGLSPRFFAFAASSALVTVGMVSYGVSSFHLVAAGLVPLAVVPLLFAGAMGVAAVAALLTGGAYDRRGPSVLLLLPVLVAAVPPLVLGRSAAGALVGLACWGAATGVQDATVKALVADLVPPARRAGAYGVFAAVQGVAALGGGLLVGLLYERSVTALSVVVVLVEVGAAALLVRTITPSRTGTG